MVSKKTIWRIHSWLGLIAGIPLLVIAFSGSVLVYKDELNALLIPEKTSVDPVDDQPLPLGERLDAAQDRLPEYVIVGWAIYRDSERSDFLYVIRRGEREWLHAYQDPYTGQILSEPAKATSDIMGWLLSLHFELLAGATGMAVNGILAIVLCMLGASGLILYRKFWKNLFTLRLRTSLRLLSGNLHRRIGVISAPVFLILGLTGAYWNITEVLHHVKGEHAEPRVTEPAYASDVPLERMLGNAEEAIPGYRLRYVDFPRNADRPITFYGESEEATPFRSPYHNTVSYDAQSGALIDHHRMDNATLWRQLVDAFTPLHFGTFGGHVSRVIWCVLGFAPGLLAISGFIVWCKRR